MSRKDETSDHRKAANPGRREFLKAASLAGVGTVAAAAAPIDGAQAEETPQDQAKARYRLGPHVERYYSLNRL